jgi:hypothetical protein
MADRSELHLPLFNNRYIVLVPQYAAQQASGRFLPGEHITTGNRELDNRAAMQLSNLNLPIINTAHHSPSVEEEIDQSPLLRLICLMNVSYRLEAITRISALGSFNIRNNKCKCKYILCNWSFI